MNEIQQLQKRVDELKRRLDERDRQQITFPLDIVSKQVVNEDVLVTTGKEVVPIGLLGATTALEVNVNGFTYWLLASPTP